MYNIFSPHNKHNGMISYTKRPIINRIGNEVIEMNFEDLIRELGGEVLNLGEPVKTVEQAVRASGVPRRKIVKSIVLIGKKTPLLVIVDGEAKVSFKKLKEMFGKVRMAKPEEVQKLTGYEIGSVPPVGVNIKTIVDKRVMENDYVLGGGGSIDRLIKIDPKRIVEHQKAEILDIIE